MVVSKVNQFRNIVPLFQYKKFPVGIYRDNLLSDSFSSVKQADVVVVLAHPDDEFFLAGTAALLAKEGYSVQFVYLTSGNNGPDESKRSLEGTEELFKEREYELYSALKTLGVTKPPILLRYNDGTTQEADVSLKIREDLKHILRSTKPRLVLTFGPDGVYGHPDHIHAGYLTDDI